MFAGEHLQERDEVEAILQVDEQVPHLSVCLHTQHKHIRPTNLHPQYNIMLFSPNKITKMENTSSYTSSKTLCSCLTLHVSKSSISYYVYVFVYTWDWSNYFETQRNMSMRQRHNILGTEWRSLKIFLLHEIIAKNNIDTIFMYFDLGFVNIIFYKANK